MTIGTMTEADRTMMLYRAIEAAKAKTDGGMKPVRERTAEERRTYMREAQRKSRERQRTVVEMEGALPTDASIREALADAAIMLLASNGPGSAQIRNALSIAFPGKSGVPFTVEQRARAGGLRPKLITVDAIKAAKSQALAEAEIATVGHVSAKPRPKPTAEAQGFRRPSFLR